MDNKLIRVIAGSPQWRQQIWKTLQRTANPAWLHMFKQNPSPISTEWGHDRGSPIDRYYIEMFLQENRRDIHGRTCEIRDATYTRKFGTGVTRSEVLDIDSKNLNATFVCDLQSADCVPNNAIDCFVCTQTLQFVYEPRAAIAHMHRFLKPGGVALVTVPGISRIDRALADVDYWRFSVASCAKLFGDCFDPQNVSVGTYGNALTAMGFVGGMSRQELQPAALDAYDPYFPVIVAVRAVKRLGNE